MCGRGGRETQGPRGEPGASRSFRALQHEQGHFRLSEGNTRRTVFPVEAVAAYLAYPKNALPMIKTFRFVLLAVALATAPMLHAEQPRAPGTTKDIKGGQKCPPGTPGGCNCHGGYIPAGCGCDYDEIMAPGTPGVATCDPDHLPSGRPNPYTGMVITALLGALVGVFVGMRIRRPKG